VTPINELKIRRRSAAGKSFLRAGLTDATEGEAIADALVPWTGVSRHRVA
jgi:hypothetical protein